VLIDYQGIRDRIFELCREHGLRPDFPETTKMGRYLLLWDSDQVVRARTFVPTAKDPELFVLERLQRDLATVFGEGWME
jgi:hypothetical protein